MKKLKQVIVFHSDGTNTPISGGVTSIDGDGDDVIIIHTQFRKHTFPKTEVRELLVRRWL